jgi:hypothetical protein
VVIVIPGRTRQRANPESRAKRRVAPGLRDDRL